MFTAELFCAFHEATNQTVLVRIWLGDKSLFDLAFVKFLYHITPLATWAVWAVKVEDAQPKFTYIIINSTALKTRAYFWKWAHLVPTKLNKTNLGTFSGHLLCCFPRTVQIFSRGYNTASWTKAVLFAYADIPFTDMRCSVEDNGFVCLRNMHFVHTRRDWYQKVSSDMYALISQR